MISFRSHTSNLYRFAAAALAVAVLLSAAACGATRKSSVEKRVIVLGFDGLDYEFTKKLMDEGQMPNFVKLQKSGGFQSLATAVPPQSPVAWSDFITGLDSGGHGIFDFIHRKPKTMIPYLSTSEPEPQDREPIQLGENCHVPHPLAEGGGHKLLRQGEPFWEVLEEAGVPTHIIRMPANFPVTGTATRELSGMGTPDVVGSPGNFHIFTSKLFAFANEDPAGEVREIWPEDGVLETELIGPPDPFKIKTEKGEAPFTVYVDPDEQRARFEIGDEEFILEAGEWSEWVPVVFEYNVCDTPLPGSTVHAEARFYLRSVRPELEFYVSPLNYDPLTPDIPLSTPPEFAAELADMTGGRYYTQGMPEESTGLRDNVITHEEFLAQAKIAGDEFVHQYDVLLDDFVHDKAGGGLFFYYFGNIDQICHMMWHTLDPEHPSYDAERDAQWADLIPSLYRGADEIVGRTLATIDENTTLVVMSDHGFASWRRTFSLNTWLEKNGYLKLKGPYMDDDTLFMNVDWSGTRAYGIGISGLYVNEKGRERNGIVNPAERDALLEEIGAKLLEEIDPETGEQAVTRVYQRERYFKSRGALEIGPDMIVGYAKGVRGENSSAMGGVPAEIMADNTSTWTGDHIMDHTTVPGVLLVNRPLQKSATSLKDLAASILAEFGIDTFPRSETRSQTAEVRYVEQGVLAQR